MANIEVPSDMIGLDAASAELDRLLASEGATGNSPAPVNPTEQSATPGTPPGEAQRAAQPGATDGQPNSSSKSDTPAAAGLGQKPPEQQQKPTEQKPGAKTPEEQASEAGKTLSRFAKDQQRREKTWAEINREKDELKASRDQVARERAELEQHRQQFQTQQQQAQYTPEQYDEAAKAFEKQGKFDLAELAKNHAAELRRNPPPTPQQRATLQQQQDAHKAAMKEWWGKAAVDYPSVAKEGSPEATALRTFLQAEPDAVRSPKGMYYAARLVTAETVAARVPDMEKELGALRAKVKELEALTAPPPPGLPTRQPGAQPQGDALAELERDALSMGPLR